MKVYLRIGKKKSGYKVEASAKPDYHPVKTGSQALPTVSFALEIDIPEEAFKQHEKSIGKIVIPEESLRDIKVEIE